MLHQIKYYRRLWQRKLRRRLRRRYYVLSTILPHLLIVCLCVIIVFSPVIAFILILLPWNILYYGLFFRLLVCQLIKVKFKDIQVGLIHYVQLSLLVTDYDLGNPRSLFDATFPMLTRIKNRRFGKINSNEIIPELAFAPTQ